MDLRIRNGLLGFLFACALWATTAGAQSLLGPTPYTSQADSPFAAQIVGGSVTLETFEDGLLNTPFVSASAGAPFGPGGITDSVDGDDGTIDGFGVAGSSFFSGSGAAGITFTFDPSAPAGLPTSAGVVWTDGDGTTLFEAFGPGGVSLGTIGPVALADGTFSGTTGEDRFFGITNAAGISAIRISNTLGGIEVDHLQYSVSAAPPPPAPPTSTADIPLLGPVGLGLLALLLGGAAVGRLRKR